MTRMPWKHLILFALASLCLAYPATLALFTVYAVTGSSMAYSLSLLVNPAVFFVFALWYFRESGASSEWASLAASAAVWAGIAFLVSVALYVPAYARPISEQFAPGVLLGHFVDFGAILLAGFISRPRAAAPPL